MSNGLGTNAQLEGGENGDGTCEYMERRMSSQIACCRTVVMDDFNVSTERTMDSAMDTAMAICTFAVTKEFVHDDKLV